MNEEFKLKYKRELSIESFLLKNECMDRILENLIFQINIGKRNLESQLINNLYSLLLEGTLSKSEIQIRRMYIEIIQNRDEE